MKNEDAERLGLYTLLANLEAEWARWSKNILLYPVIIGDALCIAKAKVKEQIRGFESIEAERAAIDGQWELMAELDKPEEMKVSA